MPEMQDEDKGFMDVIKDVAGRVTPTKEEKIREKKLVLEILKRLKKQGAEPIVVGSFAKGTDLRGNKDMDIFIMFPEDVDRNRLEKEGLKIGKKFFLDANEKYEIDYAEHPYVRGYYKGFEVEIVPCYKTNSLKSSVDRTPWHTKYVIGKIRENPSLRTNIRLLKQFMRGIDVYGAEAKVQGFSGYLAEVLTIEYGSFINVLKAATKWGTPEVIDTEKQWENKSSLSYFFTNTNLIVVDPVDRDRNVAAAVSKEKLAEFMINADEFLKSPTIEYFFPKKEKVPEVQELKELIKARGSRIIALIFTHPKINANSLYSQLRRTQKAIRDSLEAREFVVMKSNLWTNEENMSVLLFDFEIWELPKIKQHMGPPVDKDIKFQESFVEKYKKFEPYIKDDRWVVETERRFRKVEQLFPIIMKEKSGFGKDVREFKKITALKDESILKIKDGEFRIFLKKFLS